MDVKIDIYKLRLVATASATTATAAAVAAV